jgi:hypothetical protein
MKAIGWTTTVLLGALAASGCSTKRAEPSVVLETYDARGIRPGAAVYVAGVRVGQTTSVGLVGRKARIGIRLDPGGEPLHAGSCARIETFGLGGEMHVALEPGDAGPALEPGAIITCVHDSGPAYPHVEPLVDKMNAILDSVVNGRGVVGRLLRDEAMANLLADFLREGCKGPAPSAAPQLGVDAAAAATAQPKAGTGSAPAHQAKTKITMPPPLQPKPQELYEAF